jgi:hypothetical protein
MLVINCFNTPYGVSVDFTSQEMVKYARPRALLSFDGAPERAAFRTSLLRYAIWRIPSFGLGGYVQSVKTEDGRCMVEQGQQRLRCDRI